MPRAQRKRASMTTDEQIIAKGHRCDITQPGYYWVRLIVRTPPRHLPQKRKFPMVCIPSVVELAFSTADEAIIHSMHVDRRTTLDDWIFLERIAEPSNTVSAGEKP
jgi:hypothetical protein